MKSPRFSPYATKSGRHSLTPGLEHDCATAQRAQTYNVSRGHSHGEGLEMDLLRVFKRYWDAIKSVRISCDNSSIVA